MCPSAFIKASQILQSINTQVIKGTVQLQKILQGEISRFVVSFTTKTFKVPEILPSNIFCYSSLQHSTSPLIMMNTSMKMKITTYLYTINFHGILLKTVKNVKVQPSEGFPIYSKWPSLSMHTALSCSHNEVTSIAVQSIH